MNETIQYTQNPEHEKGASAFRKKMGSIVTAAAGVAMAISSLGPSPSGHLESEIPLSAQPSALEKTRTFFETDEFKVREHPSIAEAPGYGVEVSQEMREKAREATLTIGRRHKGSNERFDEVCSASKIDIGGGKSVVLTASHCFGRDTDASITDPRKDSEVEDMVTRSIYEYAIFSPDTHHNVRTLAPIAKVAHIARYVGHDGIAVVQVTDEQADYKNITALDIAPRRGIQGEEMVTSSLPQPLDGPRVLLQGETTFMGYDPSSDRYIISMDRPIESDREAAVNYGSSGGLVVNNGGAVGVILNKNQTRQFVDGFYDDLQNINGAQEAQASQANAVGYSFGETGYTASYVPIRISEIESMLTAVV